MDSDGSFREVTQEWLSNLSCPYEQYGNLKLMQDAEGTQYLYACYPNDIAVTEAGTIVSYSYLALDTYLAEDGSLVSTSTPGNYYGDGIVAVGDKVYQCIIDNTDSVTALEIRNNSQKVEETIPFSQDKSSYVYFDVLEDGTVIAADADGFFRCEAGGHEQEVIKTFSEEDAARLLEVCKMVSVRAASDIQIRNVLIEALPEYLDGTQNLEETLDAIEGGVKMYLAE